MADGLRLMYCYINCKGGFETEQADQLGATPGPSKGPSCICRAHSGKRELHRERKGGAVSFIESGKWPHLGVS